MVRKNARTCAMRGRNPNNPSDRRKGCPTEQRIEIGGGGIELPNHSIKGHISILKGGL